MSTMSTSAEAGGAGDTLADYRGLLVAQWRTQLDDVTRLSMELADQRGGDDPHPGGAETEHSSVTGRLLAAARRQLDETEAALRRLDQNAYGVCEGCRLPIPAGRLEALPAARLCVSCQQTFRIAAGGSRRR